jgi:transcriptional/translational regulatory protein YebC/TACO1
VADLKHIFDRHGGNLGEPGSVSWIFVKKGLMVFDQDKASEDKLMEIALDAGAEDVRQSGSQFEVVMEPSDFETVKKAFDDAKIPYALAEITMNPQNTVRLEGKKAEQMLNLMEALEDSDDINHVYANFDIPDEVIEAMDR